MLLLHDYPHLVPTAIRQYAMNPGDSYLLYHKYFPPVDIAFMEERKYSLPVDFF
jgi:hypothetical protein